MADELFLAGALGMDSYARLHSNLGRPVSPVVAARTSDE